MTEERTEPGFGDYVAAFAASGVIAGVALSMLEVVERSITLRNFVRGAGERLDLASHFTLVAPATMLVALAVGVVVGLGMVAFGRVRGKSTFRLRLTPATAIVIVVAVVGFLVFLQVGRPLWRFAAGRVAYHLHLQRSGDRDMLMYMLPWLFVVPLGFAATVSRAILTERIRAVWRKVAFVALAAFMALTYWMDSRWVIGIMDDSIHVTLSMVTVGAAIGCSLIAWVSLKRWRPAPVALVVAAVLATALAAVGASRINANPVVGALFWTRGVLSQRVAVALEWLADRDGDGFSAAFGGGDPDDSNPGINPLAREIPGDGVDQNGIGGDGVAGADPTDVATFAPVAPPPGPGRRNVLFISIDTLRGDHLSSYGYGRPTSPNIDAFAAKGALFERAMAQGTSTGHSFASMFTGAYGDRIFDPEQPRLGALLAGHGYRTAFLCTAPFRRFINRDDYWLYYRDIMTAGFEPVDPADGQPRRAEKLVDDAIAYLDAAPKDKPLFTWVHFRDPHAGYVRHREFDFGKKPVDRYDSEIAYTDHHLGRLFEYLEKSGVLEDTLVIVVADHGESFGEHGDFTHQRRPYRTLACVPLVVRWPGSTGVRVTSAAGPVDLAPTIANWAGITDVASRYDGIDLRWQAAQPAGALASRVVITETPRNANEPFFLAWSATEGNMHLVYDVVGPRVELFDMAADPFESHNLAVERPEETARMMGLLGRWLDRMSERPGFSGWAQMQPAIWSPAPKFPPAPPHDDIRDKVGGDDDDDE